MTTKKLTTIMMTFIGLLSGVILSGKNSEAASETEREYRRDFNRIDAMRISISRENSVRDLKAYEKFADEIAKKWFHKNRAYYARLMLEVCGLLGSGFEKRQQRNELRRKYALSALEKPDEISLATELGLIGSVVTTIIGPDVPQGEEFIKRRQEDVTIRIHAWKRLLNALDPNWNPEDLPSTVVPPTATGLPTGISPKAIKDPKLRKEYEEAIQRSRLKAEKYIEQYRLHQRLKKFPLRAEKYIVRLYSHPPFDTEELKKILIDFPEQKVKERIIEVVKQNIEDQRGK